MLLSVKDTQENWDHTVEACSNIQIGGSYETDTGLFKKTYAVWANAGINSISFYRNSNLPEYEVDYEMMLIGAFNMPYDAPPADCALNPVVHEYTCDEDDISPYYSDIMTHLEEIFEHYALLKAEAPYLDGFPTPAAW